MSMDERAANSRPNAALVAESKRSGSSSSGGAVASGMSSAGAGVAVLRGCRSSCNRTSALVFIVASVEGLVGTRAGAPMGRPRGREFAEKKGLGRCTKKLGWGRGRLSGEVR